MAKRALAILELMMGPSTAVLDAPYCVRKTRTAWGLHCVCVCSVLMACTLHNLAAVWWSNLGGQPVRVFNTAAAANGRHAHGQGNISSSTPGEHKTGFRSRFQEVKRYRHYCIYCIQNP